MTLLNGSSDDVWQIAQALNLPPMTIGFTLRARVGEIVTIEVESCADKDKTALGEVATVLKRYHLTEIEADQRLIGDTR